MNCALRGPTVALLYPRASAGGVTGQCILRRPATLLLRTIPQHEGARTMADLSRIREHMEVIGADGAHVGTVDSVSGDRIKLIKADSGSHQGHHHYVSAGLVADI